MLIVLGCDIASTFANMNGGYLVMSKKSFAFKILTPL